MRRALIIALVIVFTSHGFAALFGRITDPIHGFSVDLPRGWTVRASVNLGKILIASGDSTKIVSIFVMKGKPKEVLKALQVDGERAHTGAKSVILELSCCI